MAREATREVQWKPAPKVKRRMCTEPGSLKGVRGPNGTKNTNCSILPYPRGIMKPETIYVMFSPLHLYQ